MANKPLQSIKFPGLSDTYVVPQIDDTLTQIGRPADAKATGDEISLLKSELTDVSGTESLIFEKRAIRTDINVGDVASLERTTLTMVDSAYAPCTAGDAFIISGTPRLNNATLPYMLLDTNLVCLEKATNVPAIIENQKVIAQEDGYFVVNFLNTSDYSAKKLVGDDSSLYGVDARVTALENVVEEVEQDTENIKNQTDILLDHETIDFSTLADANYPLGWANGYIDVQRKNVHTSEYYLCTNGLVDCSNVKTVTITPPSDMAMSIILADVNDNYLSLYSADTRVHPENIGVARTVDVTMYSKIGITFGRYNNNSSSFLRQEYIDGITIEAIGFDAIVDRVTAIENNSIERYATPYHEFEDEFCESIRHDIDSNTLVVAIVTDNHFTNQQQYGLKQLTYAKAFSVISERVGVDFMVNLGDMVDSDFDDLTHAGDADPNTNADVEINIDRIAHMMEQYRSFVPFLYCMSHHERKPYISTDPETSVSIYKLDRRRVHGVCNRSQRYLSEVHRSDDSASSSYYVDFADRMIRVLVLDSTSYTQTGITPNDCTFLVSAVDNLPANYKIVIFTHCPFFWNDNNVLGYYNTRVRSHLLDTQNKGKILAWFNGHVHADNIITPDIFVANNPDDTYDFPMIWFDAQKMDVSDVIYVPTVHTTSIGNPYRNIRHFGDVTEYLFDVACIHVDTGVINLHRFGAGQYKIRAYSNGNVINTPWE